MADLMDGRGNTVVTGDQVSAKEAAEVRALQEEANQDWMQSGGFTAAVARSDQRTSEWAPDVLASRLERAGRLGVEIG